jgi:hypothetical protein
MGMPEGELNPSLELRVFTPSVDAARLDGLGIGFAFTESGPRRLDAYFKPMVAV